MTIRQYRQAKGLGQKELAAALGVPQSSVSRWERGVVAPGSATISKLAQLFECKPGDITPAMSPSVLASLPSELQGKTSKIQQACECSGWMGYPDVLQETVARIPRDWWEAYNAPHIGAVMGLLGQAYADGMDR